MKLFEKVHMQSVKPKIALVYGSISSNEELNQMSLIANECDLTFISTQSITAYMAKNSSINLNCLTLPDHENNNENYLPGLEQVLNGFDVVILKERIGMYAYQVIKAKWKYKFRLVVWVDNLKPFPGEDILQMKTIRMEVNNYADWFLVQSHGAFEALLFENVTKEKILKFRPWVEKSEKISIKDKVEAKKSLGLCESQYLIVYLGDVEWEENLEDLAFSFFYALTENPSLRDKIKAIVCGIGSYSDGLKRLSIKLGIDDMISSVLPSRAVTQELLNAADCLYMSCNRSRDHLEGSPYNLLRAMSDGLPVIASRSPIVEEILGKHRLDFCAGSAKSLQKAIYKAMNAKHLVLDLIQKNQAKIHESYSSEAVLKDMREFLTKIVEKKQPLQFKEIDQRIDEIQNFVSTKQYMAAIDLIEQTLIVEPIASFHKANLHRLIGDCFAKLGDMDSAQKAYLVSLSLDAYSPKTHVGLGTISLIRFFYDVALIQFRKALDLDPNDEMAVFGLGLTYHGLDDLEKANEWIEKTLEINPKNTAAIYTIVGLAGEREIYGSAEKALKVYLVLHPQDFEMTYSLGGVLYQQKRFGDVISLMNQVLMIDPLNIKAQTLIRQAKRKEKYLVNLIRA